MLNSPPAPILIGREGQLTVLRAFSARVASGRAGALLLRGDAGGGKTRLVTELAPEARRARRCYRRMCGARRRALAAAALIELLRREAERRRRPGVGGRGLPTEQVSGALARGGRRGAPTRFARARVRGHPLGRPRHLRDPHRARTACRRPSGRRRHDVSRGAAADHHVRQFLTELGCGQLVTPLASRRSRPPRSRGSSRRCSAT